MIIAGHSRKTTRLGAAGNPFWTIVKSCISHFQPHKITLNWLQDKTSWEWNHKQIECLALWGKVLMEGWFRAPGLYILCPTSKRTNKPKPKPCAPN